MLRRFSNMSQIIQCIRQVVMGLRIIGVDGQRSPEGIACLISLV
jgi:hypothetical protein